MASSRPSSAADESGRANQQSFLDLHNILNPIQPNSSGGVSQLGPDARKRPSLDAERAKPSQENRIYPFSEGAQDGILNRKPRRLSTPRSAPHAASLGRSSILGTDKAQQPSSASCHGRVDRIAPGTVENSDLPTIPASPTISRIPSIEIPQAVPSHTATLGTSYCTSDHCGHTSTAPRHALGATQSSSMTYQTLTDWTSIPRPFAAPNASYRLPIDSVSQSSHNLSTLNGQIRIPVDLHSGSRLSDEKRKRNAKASARFRQRRNEKEHKNSQTIANLEQKIRELTEVCNVYRKERDHLYCLIASVQDQGVVGLPTPSCSFSETL